MNWFQRKLVQATPVRHKIVFVMEQRHKIYFIEPSIMEQAQSFGHIVGKDIYIRAGLSRRVERFVIQHEIYHLKDTNTWLGWVGKEARANIICGLKDPLGLVATIRASLKMPRLKV